MLDLEGEAEGEQREAWAWTLMCHSDATLYILHRELLVKFYTGRRSNGFSAQG